MWFRLSDDFFLYKTNNSTTKWSIDNGYFDANIKTYPERGLIAGTKAGFSAILELFEKDFDYICADTSQGFQVWPYTRIASAFC